MTTLVIHYVNRSTGSWACARTFSARDVFDANKLAAAFQSEHPELKEVECQIHGPRRIPLRRELS